MKLKDLNNALRGLINNKIELGWVKSHIGKILLGANGQAHLNRFLTPNDNGIYNNFGIKPLQKIAKIIDYDVMVIFVPKNNLEINRAVEDCNNAFLSELSTSLDNYISGNFAQEKIIRTSRTQIDSVLDDIFEDTGFDDE